MGLGAVELVMAVEARFGIEIPDADAAAITTPRKLIDSVCAKVGAKDQAKCVSQRSFYRVRRILMARGIERGVITPQTRLDLLFPAAKWNQTWSKLESSLGVGPRLLFSGRGLAIFAFAAAAGGGRLAAASAWPEKPERLARGCVRGGSAPRRPTRAAAHSDDGGGSLAPRHSRSRRRGPRSCANDGLVAVRDP